MLHFVLRIVVTVSVKRNDPINVYVHNTICMYIYIYMHACMHACIHTYIHTYILMQCVYIFICITFLSMPWRGQPGGVPFCALCHAQAVGCGNGRSDM